MLAMHGFKSRSLSFNLLRQRHRRQFASKVHRLPKAGDDDDFRPPWVYTMSRLLSYTMIPAVAAYAIFVYDFGERDHVFRPARRWVAEQKATFFTLSPAEQQLLNVEKSNIGTSEKI
ncbi:hypothetical protein BDZ94DRAFT_1308181 [Collybia nuda]|uniref:Uncharacterized protein n=1 Tax=Collybia nuda TaxID=64659 RepID=A0A9P5Y7K6_9AGAR|nr:hypothetical protein BDZ94DRAFT_1308181 [Collybia nuda]